MIELVLFFIHSALLLLFGAFLSGAFSGIHFNAPSNRRHFLYMCGVCGVLQLVGYLLFSEEMVWKLYPLITHLPLLVFLCRGYHRRIATSLASIFTAYLFCQPAKLFGVIIQSVTGNAIAEYLMRIFILIVIAFVSLRYFAPYFEKLYSRDTFSVYLFGVMPMIYYIFDYGMAVYTDIWKNNTEIICEFLPFVFGAMYMALCILYCDINEKKIMAEYQTDIIRIIAEQKAKEFESIKRNEHEIRILRHDMRLFLNNLILCLDQEDNDTAKEMLSSHISRLENMKFEHFCNIEIIDYILSDFATRCEANHIDFVYTIEITALDLDKNIFASILSNALDNALNAQKALPESSRKIRLTLKNINQKLLLSVENPTSYKPVFSDGLPVSPKEGHGYGTQSIRYMTERLNGKCQFTIKGHTFVTKVIV